MKIETRISVCGVNCTTDCRAFSIECEGCIELQGKVGWAEFYGMEHCPIYGCVREKGLVSCAVCGNAPCRIWFDTRNPDASDDEFAADLANRLQNLKKNSFTD